MDGITYQEDCRIGANILSFLCGSSWQQTQLNKALFIGFILVVLLLVIFLVKRKFWKKVPT